MIIWGILSQFCTCADSPSCRRHCSTDSCCRDPAASSPGSRRTSWKIWHHTGCCRSILPTGSLQDLDASPCCHSRKTPALPSRMRGSRCTWPRQTRWHRCRLSPGSLKIQSKNKDVNNTKITPVLHPRIDTAEGLIWSNKWLYLSMLVFCINTHWHTGITSQHLTVEWGRLL